MPGLDDLTEDELAAIVTTLRDTIDRDRYPLSPRLAPLKSALAKLDLASVPKARVERSALPEAPEAPTRGPRRTKARR